MSSLLAASDLQHADVRNAGSLGDLAQTLAVAPRGKDRLSPRGVRTLAVCGGALDARQAGGRHALADQLKRREGAAAWLPRVDLACRAAVRAAVDRFAFELGDDLADARREMRVLAQVIKQFQPGAAEERHVVSAHADRDLVVMGGLGVCLGLHTGKYTYHGELVKGTLR